MEQPTLRALLKRAAGAEGTNYSAIRQSSGSGQKVAGFNRHNISWWRRVHLAHTQLGRFFHTQLLPLLAMADGEVYENVNFKAGSLPSHTSAPAQHHSECLSLCGVFSRVRILGGWDSIFATVMLINTRSNNARGVRSPSGASGHSFTDFNALSPDLHQGHGDQNLVLTPLTSEGLLWIYLWSLSSKSSPDPIHCSGVTPDLEQGN